MQCLHIYFTCLVSRTGKRGMLELFNWRNRGAVISAKILAPTISS